MSNLSCLSMVVSAFSLFLLMSPGLALFAVTPDYAKAVPELSSQINSLSSSQTSQKKGSAFDYIVVIFMENKNYDDIIGKTSSAPFINRLGSNFGIALNYFTVSNKLSLPNYLGATTGQTFDSWSGCNAPPSRCPGFVPIIASTIVDLIESAGLSWKAYMENMPANCYPNDSGKYVARHDPFVYFANVLRKPADCDRVVPGGARASNLLSDLSSITTASNFMWLTPNICNDMHDCSIEVGDRYLSQVIPLILNSSVFRTQKSILFLTWDEGSGGDPHPPAIWAGPVAKNNYTTSVRYDHYSFPKTLETIWNLPSLTINDATSRPMTEFLNGPTTSFSYFTSSSNTHRISFNATAMGGAIPYTSYDWNFGDGTSSSDQSIVHVYSKTGQYKVTLSVVDRFNNTGTFTSTATVTDYPPEPEHPPSTRNTQTKEVSSRLDFFSLEPEVFSIIVAVAASIVVFAGSLVRRGKQSVGT